MKLRTRLGVAAGLVLVVLVAAGVLLPRTVRAAQIEQVDSQLRSAVPGTMGLFPGPDRRGPRPDQALNLGPDGTPLNSDGSTGSVGDGTSPTTTVPGDDGSTVVFPPDGTGIGDGSSPTDGDGSTGSGDGTTGDDEQPQLVNTALSDIYVALIDGETRDVRLSSPVAEGREPDLPSVSAELDDPTMVTVGSVRGDGKWRAMLLTLPDGIQILVAVPLDRVDATAQRLMAAIVVAAGAVLLALVAAGWWLLRLGLRPIAEVTQVADAIAQGDRTRRVGGAPGPRGRRRHFRRHRRRKGKAGTEADQLARAFNVMLDEQAATEAQLRQFVADASHELRTPVAAIRGFADLWRSGALGEDQLDDVMRRIGQESTRMRGLVEDLLLLARLDQGRVLAVEPVDLSALAADAVLDASATHPSRTVRLEASQPAVVTGDEARLRQVIANLVSNALVHTTATTTVVIQAGGCPDSVGAAVGAGVGAGETARLAVCDDGPGMDAEAAARAFDRFWRGDPGRARGGAGLGLSIVRSIVAAHHGDVVLTSRPGAGTSVEVVLPAAPQHAVPTPLSAEADRAGSYV